MDLLNTFVEKTSWVLSQKKARVLVGERDLNSLINNLYQISLGEEIKNLIWSTQSLIYRIDFYGEQYWQPDQGVLDILWSDVTNHLLNSGNYSCVTEELIENLLKYQEFELLLREKPKLHSFNLKEILNFKSSDVQLLRHIIISNSNLKPSEAFLNSCNIIDSLKEIFDDMFDIREDIGTYNFNLFIQSNSVNSKLKVNKIPKRVIPLLNQLLSNLSENLPNTTNEEYLLIRRSVTEIISSLHTLKLVQFSRPMDCNSSDLMRGGLIKNIITSDYAPKIYVEIYR